MLNGLLYKCGMCYYKVPYAYSKSLYEVDINFFKKIGIKYLFCDLDNTLDSYQRKEPSDKAKELIKILKENSITPIIISNNRGKRVSTYANALDIDYLCSSGKPFPFRIKKFMKAKKIDPNEVMMVGDQLATDIKCAVSAGIKSLLVDKLVKEDQLTTRINRFFEKLPRKQMMKKGKLIDWRIIYGKM